MSWCYTIFAIDIYVMALEIKRTPVLEGKEAERFLFRIENSKFDVSAKEVNYAILKAKKILSNRKNG
jgi:hypothetical protein